MKNRRITARQPKRRWKETRISLAAAKALILDGPGSEWLFVLRGERTQQPRGLGRKAKGGRS